MPVGRRVGKKQRQMGGGAWDGLCVHVRWSLVASKVRLVSMDGACIQGRSALGGALHRLRSRWE